ncbi:MAG: NAD(P)-dependent oxidoreductase [Candidatus Rokubacteria bacterium]|nr:NAD(P)-dependent oxidoreductase [Candidatus Rokubacteria bacterium]
MKRIAVVGVGLLGGAVAQRLLAGGFEVAGHDVRRDTVDALVPRGLRPAADLADAVADADVIFTILPSLDIVDATLRGADGVFACARRDVIVAQMSTISPPLTRALGDAAAARGIRFLDTPMSGTSAMVARGDCTIFVAGDPAHADAARPVFDAIGRKTLYVGPVGTATVAKLATNLLVGLNTAALAEALVLGAKGGLEPARLLDILRESAAASRMVDVRGPLMVQRDFTAQMKLDLFLKDFTLMLEEGKRVGAPLLLTGIARELAAAAANAGHGSDDLAAIVTTIERMAGLGDR